MLKNYKTITDHLNFTFTYSFPPKKIVSLVPSLTELLYDLSLEENIAGITKFCIHPNKIYRSKVRVGGTKTVNIEKIKKLNPDLIIANKEENTKKQILELKSLFPVWVSNIKNINDAYKSIMEIGEMTNKVNESKKIITKIKNGFEKLKKSHGYLKLKRKTVKVAYLIWQNPYMTVNKNTFINNLLELCGFKNVFANFNESYPKINEKELIKKRPEIIMLSSEPYPFKEKHKLKLEKNLPKSKIIFVDGEMFSWYGSRLIYASKYFMHLLEQI